MELAKFGPFPAIIPVVVESDIFLYPFMISPLFLADPKNIASVNEAVENNTPILVVTTKEGGKGEFYDAGTIGVIMRKVSLPDKRIKALFQGFARGIIQETIADENNKALMARVEEIETKPYHKQNIDAMLESLRGALHDLINVSSHIPPDILQAITDNQDPSRIVDLVASAVRLKNSEAYSLFIETDLEARIMRLLEMIAVQTENAKLQREIRGKVHSKIDQNNREYFLKEQLKQIRKELGEDSQRDEEIEEYQKKLDAKKPFMPEEGYKEAKKQLDRLGRMHPDSADSNLLQTYIEWVLEMPFGEIRKAKLSVQAVAKRLESDHFSLKKPKERIVEYFAVKELLEQRGVDDRDSRGTILCFVGPPGVGKTSLANSIAKALKRELVRIALGGMEDVNELRGHRRTYIGAMPGRIVQGLINAKSMHPVMVLDEIDKVGRSMRGDPMAALLEILDPEQNDHFRDYYLNFSIDLSHVIFIATANDLGTVPAPLRDRMEVIAISSYTPQEKIEIAKRYLIPQELKKHGLKKDEIRIAPSAIREMAEKYTKEAGVRNLRRAIAKVMRKSAKVLLERKMESVSITIDNLEEFLEKKIYEIEPAEKKNLVGVVNGLAWTSIGGDVLKIEAVKIQAKGALALTGSLGDVMKESAQIAYSVVKTLIDSGKIRIRKDDIPLLNEETEKNTKPKASEIYNRYSVHVHVPEGGIPKDGPSAGVAMAVAIASILSGSPVRRDLAMTGELTLTGRVLPIGGLKEKLIAAYRAKMKTVLIPEKNFENDMDEIPDEVKDSLKTVPINRIEEAIRAAFEK
ncbi:MAG: endopeptidase La [Helicobacteraceae bacterium]|jgi:ATP-dependent Lon protease|nr:endopeptidase La [Helicobacteraceae bacterium]